MKTLKLYGPPGTGKTHRLLQLFEEELKHTSPNRIAFVTFTRAARQEALERTKMEQEDLPYVKTLHSICYKQLGISHDQLVMGKDIRAFGKAIGVQLNGYVHDSWALDVLTEADSWRQPSKADRLLQLNHLGRHRGMKLKEALRDAPEELDYAYAKWFTEAYKKWKAEEGKLDYTDLLTKYLDVGPDLDCDVLFIDEAQDLSWLQWQVVRKLGNSGVARRYIAGDDDQAIFIWAGASAELFNTEPADEVVVLPQSFRLARAVHAASQGIIRRVRVRYDKEFLPRDSAGVFQPVGYLDRQWLNQGKTLLLFRNHHRGMQLAGKLEELGVPFLGPHSPLADESTRLALLGWTRVLKDEPLPPQEAKALVGACSQAYLQGGATMRAVKATGALPPTSLLQNEAFRTDWWRVLARLPKLSYFEKVLRAGDWGPVLNPTVQLMSIHQSKGREADTVVLDLEMARRTYEAYMENPDEEHRVYYVAATRARENLYTLLPSEPMAYQL